MWFSRDLVLCRVSGFPRSKKSPDRERIVTPIYPNQQLLIEGSAQYGTIWLLFSVQKKYLVPQVREMNFH